MVALNPNPVPVGLLLVLSLLKLNLPKALGLPKLLTLPKPEKELLVSSFFSSFSLPKVLAVPVDLEPNPKPSVGLNEPKPKVLAPVLFPNVDPDEPGVVDDDDVPKLAFSPKFGCVTSKPPEGTNDDDEDEPDVPNEEKPLPPRPSRPPRPVVAAPSNTLSLYFFSNFLMSSISLPLYFTIIFGNSSNFSGLCLV